MAADNFLDEEFWWLSMLGFPPEGQVGVALSRWSPPTEDSQFQPIDGHLSIENLGTWAGEHLWENIHRTLEVVVVGGNAQSIVGPIVIDVDADEDLFDQFSKPGNDLLGLAKLMTLDVVRHLATAGVSGIHRRVYFSGHKGFHVHFVTPGRPEMHKTGSRRTLWRDEISKLREALHLNKHSRVGIDPPHDFVRLSTSVNRWGPSGSESRNRVIRIREDDLRMVTIDELWELSKINLH